MAVPTINTETLMRAVLAMDVYHREYNWGVSRDPERDPLTNSTSDLPDQVGNWFVGDSDPLPEIGFMAQAYTNGGQTILAFRGTDDGFANPLWNSGTDMLNGFGIGAGSPVGPQALAAINFYNSLDTSNIEMVGQGRS